MLSTRRWHRLPGFEPREYFTAGDDVVAFGSEEVRVRATGKTRSTNWMMLIRIRGGMVWYFHDTLA